MKRSSLTPQLNSSNSLVDMLRKPFRRKSVPSSPVTGRSGDPGVGSDLLLSLEPQPLSLIVPEPIKHSISLHSLDMVSLPVYHCNTGNSKQGLLGQNCNSSWKTCFFTNHSVQLVMILKIEC